MHKRLIPQNNSKEQVDQDRYNALVSKLDTVEDDKNQPFKWVLKNVHKDYKQKINKQLEIENGNKCISIQAELYCKSCRNFRLIKEEYLHHCYCGKEAYVCVTITNLFNPVFVYINVNIEKQDLQLINIIDDEYRGILMAENEVYQKDWQFPLVKSDSMGCKLEFNSFNEYVYGGDYFSSNGDLTLVCNIKVDVVQRGADQWYQLYPSKPLRGTFSILASRFSDANVNPNSPLDDQLIDVILLVGSNRIYCHKLVLAMTSRFFERMFASDMKESNSKEIELREVNLDTITNLISFMYRDTIEDDKINVDLLAAADMYEVLRLKNICSSKLAKTINARNVAEIWHCAYLHDVEDLAHRSMIYMMRSWKELSKQDDVRELCKKYPDLLFSISTLMADTNDKKD